MNKSFCLDLTLCGWATCVRGGEIRGARSPSLWEGEETSLPLTSSPERENNRPVWPSYHTASLKCLPSTLLTPSNDSLLCCASSPQGVGGQSPAREELAVTHSPKDHSLCSQGRDTALLSTCKNKPPKTGSLSPQPAFHFWKEAQSSRERDSR